MISNIELVELNDNIENLCLKIDLFNETISQIINGEVINRSVLNINFNEINELSKKYIIFWDNEYVNDILIGGMQIKLFFIVDDQAIDFNFKNKYPYNFNEYINQLKEMVKLYE